MLPLSGLTVLDLTRLLPGPYATLVMADLGARVDKIEDPQGGDPTRHMPPMKGETSAFFLALNRNKRSVTIDLKSSEGAATFRQLVTRYDVLVESFRPGVMEKLGLGYEALAALNPRLIYCAITGYGASGPDRLRAGHDLNYIARSGVLGYGGSPGAAPAMPGVQVADIGGGSLFALVGILAALHERNQTGKGRFVDVSMTEGSMAFLHMHLAARLLMGGEGTPLARGVEGLNGGFACYGLYRTRDDRWMAVASLEPKFFSGLCEALERPELLPGGYATGAEGAATRRELEAIFASRTQEEWVSFFRDKDLCVEPVREGDEVMQDAQLRDRGMFVEAGSSVHVRTPLNLGEMRIEPAPALGEHNDLVLGQPAGPTRGPTGR